MLIIILKLFSNFMIFKGDWMQLAFTNRLVKPTVASHLTLLMPTISFLLDPVRPTLNIESHMGLPFRIVAPIRTGQRVLITSTLSNK